MNIKESKRKIGLITVSVILLASCHKIKEVEAVDSDYKVQAKAVNFINDSLLSIPEGTMLYSNRLVQSDWGFPAILRDYYEDLYCDSINHQKPYEIIKIMVDSMFLEPNTFDYQRYNKENKDVTFVLDDDVFKTKDSSVVIGGLFFTDIAYSKDKNFFGVYYNYLSYRKGEKSKGESVYFKKDTTSGKFIYSHKVEAFQQETKQKGIGLGITLKLREDFKKDFCPCCPR